MATVGQWELEEHVGSERYLVTGGLGCIGAWTLRNLVRSGADVVSFDLGAVHRRPGLIMTPEELAAVTFVQGDITRKEDIDSVLDENQITRVIHLAALQFPFCKADPVLGSQVNVVGTVNMFQAAAERRDQIAKIVYASSVATFDESDDDGGPVSSDQQGNPVSLYGVFKAANEGTAKVFWLDENVSSIGLRPWTVYGVARDQGQTSTPTKAMLAAALGVPYEISFGGRLQFQLASDIAEMFIRSVHAGVSGALVLNTGGAVHSMTDVVDAIDLAMPSQAGNITFADASMPYPPEFDGEALSDVIGPLPNTPLDRGVAETVESFAQLVGEGRLTEEDLK
jgi:UDP-glucuronate 4-epimerase